MLVLRKAMFSRYDGRWTSTCLMFECWIYLLKIDHIALNRSLEARKIAVYGFLIVLKHFKVCAIVFPNFPLLPPPPKKKTIESWTIVVFILKVSGGNITSSQSISHSSQCSSHSLSQIQVDVHSSNNGLNSGNEALCLEIIGLYVFVMYKLKICFANSFPTIAAIRKGFT